MCRRFARFAGCPKRSLSIQSTSRSLRRRLRNGEKTRPRRCLGRDWQAPLAGRRRETDDRNTARHRNWRNATDARILLRRRGDSWTAVVDLPPDPTTGKRRQKRVTARTKKEVEAGSGEADWEGATGFTDAGKVTVREFLDNWLVSVGSLIATIDRTPLP